MEIFEREIPERNPSRSNSVWRRFCFGRVSFTSYSCGVQNLFFLNTGRVLLNRTEKSEISCYPAIRLTVEHNSESPDSGHDRRRRPVPDVVPPAGRGWRSSDCEPARGARTLRRTPCRCGLFDGCSALISAGTVPREHEAVVVPCLAQRTIQRGTSVLRRSGVTAKDVTVLTSGRRTRKHYPATANVTRAKGKYLYAFRPLMCLRFIGR